MWGDQLARQFRIIREIEASPNGLTVVEIAKREETGIRTIYRGLEALQAAGFPLYPETIERACHWAFVDTLNFKIPKNFRELILSCESAKPLKVFGFFASLCKQGLLFSESSNFGLGLGEIT